MKINEIKFENVNFSYKNGQNIYKKNLNMIFEKGNIYLIQGKNGTGKSTLVKMLMKFYDNYEGNISLNGISQRKISRDKILSQIAIAFQDTPVFYDSIINNISLGKNIENHDKVLNTFNFINDLKDSGRTLDTILIEGKGLSGGQMQKLGIIRALLSEKSVYIFDEPTSNLDFDSKNEFYNILSKLRKNHIVLLVSHEENVEQFVDKIFSLDEK